MGESGDKIERCDEREDDFHLQLASPHHSAVPIITCCILSGASP